MLFSLDSCTLDPTEPLTTGPNSFRCREAKARIKAVLMNSYAARFRPPIFANVPLGPRPVFSDILKDIPDPQTSMPEIFELQNALNGELFASILRLSDPTPVIKQIRDNGLALEAATEVLTQLRSAANALEEDVKELNKFQNKQ